MNEWPKAVQAAHAAIRQCLTKLDRTNYTGSKLQITNSIWVKLIIKLNKQLSKTHIHQLANGFLNAIWYIDEHGHFLQTYHYLGCHCTSARIENAILNYYGWVWNISCLCPITDSTNSEINDTNNGSRVSLKENNLLLQNLVVFSSILGTLQHLYVPAV